MSAAPNDRTTPNPPVPTAESRRERWAKYGSNTMLTIVIAILLAGLLTYIAQANNWKWDTTRGGVNSLRPQTINVLHNLNTDIKLVSLYSKSDQTGETPAGGRAVDRPAMVADLLDNYKAASKHVTTETIDPTDKAKLDALQSDLDERYGKGIKDYKDFLGQYDAAAKQLMSLVTDQVAVINSLLVSNKDDEVANEIAGTLKALQTELEDSRADLRRRMSEHRPDYRGIVNGLRDVLGKISGISKQLVDLSGNSRTDVQIPPAVRSYIAANQAKFKDIQTLADRQVGKIDKLSSLKVDEVQRALNRSNPILVLGPNDWRVIGEDEVWTDANAVRVGSDGKLQPAFAGEQQVTGAILSLASPKKPKVAILRPFGGPLASPGFPPFRAGGPLSDLAARLRLANFDVVEKDMSGQWAMQAQMQQQMVPPEPSWNDIADAVWLILDTGSPIQGQDQVGQLLATHLGHGGSAVILAQPRQNGGMEAAGGPDTFAPVLKDWGIDLRTDLMAVHDEPPPPPSTDTDPLQDFLRRPIVFDVRQYGDAELARPLQNLQALLLLVAPVTTRDVAGYTIQHLIPLPDAPAAPKSWGEKEYQAVMGKGDIPKFDPAKDMPGPVFAGAVSEKKDGGRLVVMGDIQFAFNQWSRIADEAAARDEDRFVARFPGNSELAVNSVLWAAKMDQMIALSPAALQVSRIGNMGEGTLNFWRIGLVLVLLPAAVLGCGLGMYFSRRD